MTLNENKFGNKKNLKIKETFIIHIHYINAKYISYIYNIFVS